MGISEGPLQSFERGQRVSTRGARWTVIDTEPGADCIALRLSGDQIERSQTLIAPFDRFRHDPGSAAPAVVRFPRWLRYVRSLGTRTYPAGGLQAVVSAGIQLLPYQLEPALAVCRHGATRLLIADAVGLGKTVQAGLLVAELATRSSTPRVLILVPAGLRDQWAQELARLFGLATIAAHSGWIRAIGLERPAEINPWALPGIYLASQDLVKRPEVLRPLEDVTWDLVVIDEAHASSSRSDRRAAAHAIAVRSGLVVLLTATPHADDPTEFAALCSIGIADRTEPPLVLFQRTRQEVSTAAARRSALLSVRSTAAEGKMHALLEQYTSAVWRESQARGDELARLAAIVLRKRALSSAASLAVSVQRRMTLLSGLPDPVQEQLRLPLADEDPLEDDESAVVLGAPGLKHAPKERRWLAAILGAAQLASHAESKMLFLRRLLHRIQEPVIIFTEYRDTLIRLSALLAATDRPLILLHGGMGPADRGRVQRRFNEGGAVLLATDAAAEGLNLHTQCRLVVHYELPWSLSRLEQRAGRVDRLGQQRRVHELGLVATGTAERLVLEPLLRRASRARASISELNGLSATLTDSRIAELIVGGAPAGSPPASALAPPPTGMTRVMNLGPEALDEVRRLTSARECVDPAGRTAAGDRSGRPLASSMRSRRAHPNERLILLYLISLTSRSGREVHVEPLVIELRLSIASSYRIPSARALREIVRPFGEAPGPLVGDQIATAIRRALNLAVPVQSRVENEQWRRQEAIKRRRTSAARQLVQAGLFERRHITGAGMSKDTVSQPELQYPGRAPAPVLGVHVSLAGALLVLSR